jgi:dipeptidyl aminopeptidase/acylaminoacyl peptidase
MKRSFRFVLFAVLGASALILAVPLPTYAQGTPPAGVVAFVGVDSTGSASLYVMDIASGRIGQIVIPVAPETDLAWNPAGDTLAFVTQDGGYGLLNSLRGCFDATATCADTVEVLTPFITQQIEWSPDGDLLYFLTDDGMKVSAPRARPNEITDLSLACSAGFAISREPFFLFCANEDSAGDIQTSVYQVDGSNFTKLYDLGTFPHITKFDVGPDGRSAVGTEEAAGDSGFYSPASGTPSRFAAYQIHVYDLEFRPDGNQIVIVGATADSTGDGTLRDGDAAELFLYDTATGQLHQVAGFTNATAATWSPDGNHILTVINDETFRIYTPSTNQTTPLNAALPEVSISSPAWVASESTPPIIGLVTATPAPLQIVTATPAPLQIVTATPLPRPTAPPTLTPLPTLTPFPTPVPLPTFTPIPSATPGSPMGSGCQYVYSGAQPVNVGDTAEVTQYGAAVRFRTAASLTATMLSELRPGTRMTILSGPYCADGYRWWQARLESDGRIGYLADSDPTGYWIQKVAPAQPTLPAESISFYADRYSIAPGECVTIHWDLEGIKEVYFEGTGTTGHNSAVVCPGATTTYTLRIVRLDNSDLYQQLTIAVVLVY